jgi:Transposase DDE domain
MVTRKTLCLKRLGGDRAGELRAGRFFANPRVTVAKIVESWGARTGPASAGRHILAIQDRSEVVFSTTPRRRRGLGKVGKGNAFGVLVHAMIAVDAATGACLGLVGGDVWTRDAEPAGDVYARPLEERESIHWSRTAEQAKTILSPAAQVTVVADREADIYAQWASVPETGFDLLIRAMSDRRLADGGMLSAAIAGFAVASATEIEVPAHQPGQPSRRARLELRFGEVEVCRPRDPRRRHLRPTVRLRVIDVREVAPPACVEPLHWRLLTTHEIDDAAAAWRIVGWYRARWTIEQLFRVMKSRGLGLEDSLVGSANRLVKLAAAAVKAACVDIQLVQERDGEHRSDCATVFSASEAATLEALNATLQGNTQRQRNPHPKLSLAWAAWVVARLGGWNCYYKPPGPITMRRGMEQFHAIHRGRVLQLTLQRDVRIL